MCWVGRAFGWCREFSHQASASSFSTSQNKKATWLRGTMTRRVLLPPQTAPSDPHSTRNAARWMNWGEAEARTDPEPQDGSFFECSPADSPPHLFDDDPIEASAPVALRPTNCIQTSDGALAAADFRLEDSLRMTRNKPESEQGRWMNSNKRKTARVKQEKPASHMPATSSRKKRKMRKEGGALDDIVI
ncbi:hypothetical protein QOT17_016370 [Balamuthia mandrillaris]